MSTIGSIFVELSQEEKEAGGDAFEGLEAPVETDWSIGEAYMCILLSAIYADGVATPEEVEYVKALVKRCKTFRSQTTDSLAQLNLSVSERMKQIPDPVGEACRTLPKDMHLPLFAHCVDIVLSDRELAERERNFLDELIEKMSISSADAKKTMEVIFSKNRY